MSKRGNIRVRKNSGAIVGSRRLLNFIEGLDTDITITDDGPGDEIDITIAAANDILEGETAFVGPDETKDDFTNYWYCNGTADQVEVALADAYVAGLGGGCTFMEAMDYDFSATYTQSANVDLRGTGYGTNIVVSANVNGITAANRVTISDLRMTETGSTSAAIYFSNKNNYKVQNVTTVGFRYGVHSRFGVEFEICGCKMEATDLYGIFSEGSDRGDIHDNITEDVVVVGIYIQRPLRLTVGGNEIINMAPGGGGTAHCMFVTNHAAEEADSVSITRNICRINGTTDGINVNGIVVSGEASDTHLTSNITITGNCVYGDGGPDVGRGIYIHGDSGTNRTTRDIPIIGNTVEGMNDGIVVTFSQKVEVIGNTIDVANIGVYLSNSIDCDVDNNSITGAITGISESGVDNRIGYNNCTGCTAVAAIAGTDTRLPYVWDGVVDPTTTLGEHRVLELPDNADTHVYGELYVPLDFQELVTCQVIVISAANGDMVWTVATDFGKLCASEDYNAHSDSDNDADTLVINDLECIDISAALTDIAAGDIVGINFMRDGDAGGDTINDMVYYKGIRMRYV